ncbi:MAG: zinc ribbon domain-containing protein [Candidatus Lokiarchaeota archaeon]|nr:zinc ribbon domain-containing protein [Candidatus Lokiarchaeota archaeon]
MVKLLFEYKIINQKTAYNPGDEIEGIMYITSQEKKTKKIKKIQAQIIETYETFVVRSSGPSGPSGPSASGSTMRGTEVSPGRFRPSPGVEMSSGGFRSSAGAETPQMSGGYMPRYERLKIVEIKDNDEINSNEKKEYPFKFTLPQNIIPKNPPSASNWRIFIYFRDDSAKRLPKGQNKDSSIFNVPIGSSQEPPSEDMKFCSSCGKKVKKSAQFCEHCGSNL